MSWKLCFSGPFSPACSDHLNSGWVPWSKKKERKRKKWTHWQEEAQEYRSWLHHFACSPSHNAFIICAPCKAQLGAKWRKPITFPTLIASCFVCWRDKEWQSLQLWATWKECASKVFPKHGNQEALPCPAVTQHDFHRAHWMLLYSPRLEAFKKQ